MISITNNRIIFVGLALIAGTLACSTPGQTSGGQPAPTAIITAEQPADGQTAAPAVNEPPANVTAACPKAGEGTTLYVSEKDGMCFLYPSELKAGTVFQLGGRSAGFSGPPLDPSSMEPAAVHIEVTYNGPADVSTSAEYGKKWHEIYGTGASDPVETTVGGQPAMLVPDVPGMMAQQMALVVVNGQKYSVMSTSPDMFEELRPQVEKAWSTITGSIVFFPPSDIPTIVRAEDVCPTSQAVSEIQLIDWAGGVCMLYPASFDINAEFGHGTGWFEGGEFLGEIFSRPLKAELVISYAGPAEGKTPRQLWEPRLVNTEVSKIDVAGAKDVTLSGQPAIVWTEAEPLGSRQAIIVANNRMYTVVNQPYNDPDFPNGADNVELIWTVTENLAFFDPWH